MHPAHASRLVHQLSLLEMPLAILAGYGYRLPRIFITYAIALAAFTLVFWALGIHSFIGESWWQAMWDSFLVSLSAIH
jgi:hypothetical protein